LKGPTKIKGPEATKTVFRGSKDQLTTKAPKGGTFQTQRWKENHEKKSKAETHSTPGRTRAKRTPKAQNTFRGVRVGRTKSHAEQNGKRPSETHNLP